MHTHKYSRCSLQQFRASLGSWYLTRSERFMQPSSNFKKPANMEAFIPTMLIMCFIISTKSSEAKKRLGFTPTFFSPRTKPKWIKISPLQKGTWTIEKEEFCGAFSKTSIFIALQVFNLKVLLGSHHHPQVIRPFTPSSKESKQVRRIL